MRTLSYFLLLTILINLASCNSASNNAGSVKQTTFVGNDTLTITKSSNLKSTLKLTAAAQGGVIDWQFYKDLSRVMDSLNPKSIGDLKKNLDDFTTIYETQENAEESEIPATPEKIDTKAIGARLLVIETKFNVLQNSATKSNPNVSDISQKLGELHNAFQNLKLQLNERFSSNLKDLLEEIKKENQEALNKKDTII